MIGSFNFSVLPKIIFGKGKSAELPKLIKGYGDNIILVTGKESFQNNPEGEKIVASLKDNGITANPVVVTGEPSPAIVDKTARFFREKGDRLCCGDRWRERYGCRQGHFGDDSR